MNSDTQLLAQFVASFRKFDDTDVIACTTEVATLAALQSRLSARLPRLFELLLASYRWSKADLGRLCLLPNPSGAIFEGFAAELFADCGLTEVLLPQGFIPFGRATTGAAYDPICFDTRRQRHGGDCPVVRLDHEAALIGQRVRPVAELTPTFRELVTLIIAEASARP